MHASTSGFLHKIWKSNSDCQACADAAFTHRAVCGSRMDFHVSVLYQAHGRTWFNVFLVTQEPWEWTV